MSINIIKEEIDILIDTIREQHDILKEYKGKIPQIELDIVMSNVRDLYEYLTELNKINNLRKNQMPVEVSQEIIEKIAVSRKEKSITEAAIEEKPETKKELIEFSEIETKEVFIHESIPVIEEQQVIVEEFIKEDITDLVETVITETVVTEEKIEPEVNAPLEEKAEEVKVTEIKKETKESKKTSKSEKAAIIDLFAESDKTSLSDKFKDEKKSLNEKLGEDKKEKSLADKILKKPIKDLKTAIGINDKFIFINELFKGSLQEYNKAIETINSFATDKEAFLFIEELKEKYNWEEKPDIYVKLEDFVLRKFL